MKRKFLMAVIAVLVLCLTCGMLLVACNNGNKPGDNEGNNPPPPPAKPVTSVEAFNTVMDIIVGSYKVSDAKKMGIDVDVELGVDESAVDGEKYAYGLIAKGDINVLPEANPENQDVSEIYLAFTQKKGDATEATPLFELGYSGGYFYLSCVGLELGEQKYLKIDAFSLAELAADIIASTATPDENAGPEADGSILDTILNILKRPGGVLFDPEYNATVTENEDGSTTYDMPGLDLSGLGQVSDLIKGFLVPSYVKVDGNWVKNSGATVASTDGLLQFIGKFNEKDTLTDEDKATLDTFASIAGIIDNVIKELNIQNPAANDAVAQNLPDVVNCLFGWLSRISGEAEITINADGTWNGGFQFDYKKDGENLYGEYDITVNSAYVGDKGVEDVFAKSGINEVIADKDYPTISLLNFAVEGKVVLNSNTANNTYDIKIKADLDPFELLQLLKLESLDFGKPEVQSAFIDIINNLGYLEIIIDETTEGSAHNVLTLIADLNGTDTAAIGVTAAPYTDWLRISGKVTVQEIAALANSFASPSADSGIGGYIDAVTGLLESIDFANIKENGFQVEFDTLIETICAFIPGVNVNEDVIDGYTIEELVTTLLGLGMNTNGKAFINVKLATPEYGTVSKDSYKSVDSIAYDKALIDISGLDLGALELNFATNGKITLSGKDAEEPNAVYDVNVNADINVGGIINTLMSGGETVDVVELVKNLGYVNVSVKNGEKAVFDIVADLNGADAKVGVYGTFSGADITLGKVMTVDEIVELVNSLKNTEGQSSLDNSTIISAVMAIVNGWININISTTDILGTVIGALRVMETEGLVIDLSTLPDDIDDNFLLGIACNIIGIDKADVVAAAALIYNALDLDEHGLINIKFDTIEAGNADTSKTAESLAGDYTVTEINKTSISGDVTLSDINGGSKVYGYDLIADINADTLFGIIGKLIKGETVDAASILQSDLGYLSFTVKGEGYNPVEIIANLDGTAEAAIGAYVTVTNQHIRLGGVLTAEQIVGMINGGSQVAPEDQSLQAAEGDDTMDILNTVLGIVSLFTSADGTLSLDLNKAVDTIMGFIPVDMSGVSGIVKGLLGFGENASLGIDVSDIAFGQPYDKKLPSQMEAMSSLDLSVDGKAELLDAEKNVVMGRYTVDFDADINISALLGLLEGTDKENIINVIKNLGYISLTVNEISEENTFVQNVVTLHSDFSTGTAFVQVNSYEVLGKLALGGLYDFDVLASIIGELAAPAAADGGIDIGSIINALVSYCDFSNLADNGFTFHINKLVDVLAMVGGDLVGMVGGLVANIWKGAEYLNIKLDTPVLGGCVEKDITALDALIHDSTGSSAFVKNVTSIEIGDLFSESQLAPSYSNTFAMKGHVFGSEEEQEFKGYIVGHTPVDMSVSGSQSVTFYVGIENDGASLINTLAGILSLPGGIPFFGAYAVTVNVDIIAFDENAQVSIVDDDMSPLGDMKHATGNNVKGFNLWSQYKQGLEFPMMGKYAQIWIKAVIHDTVYTFKVLQADWDYDLLDKEGNDVTALYVTDEDVLSPDIPYGEYTLRTYYAGYHADRKLLISNIHTEFVSEDNPVIGEAFDFSLDVYEIMPDGSKMQIATSEGNWTALQAGKLYKSYANLIKENIATADSENPLVLTFNKDKQEDLLSNDGQCWIVLTKIVSNNTGASVSSIRSETLTITAPAA